MLTTKKMNNMIKGNTYEKKKRANIVCFLWTAITESLNYAHEQWGSCVILWICVPDQQLLL